MVTSKIDYCDSEYYHEKTSVNASRSCSQGLLGILISSPSTFQEIFTVIALVLFGISSNDTCVLIKTVLRNGRPMLVYIVLLAGLYAHVDMYTDCKIMGLVIPPISFLVFWKANHCVLLGVSVPHCYKLKGYHCEYDISLVHLVCVLNQTNPNKPVIIDCRKEIKLKTEAQLWVVAKSLTSLAVNTA